MVLEWSETRKQQQQKEEQNETQNYGVGDCAHGDDNEKEDLMV